MIYCVWYPSGGFGHFINGVLTLHGKGFKRPTNDLKFSENGNSHGLNLVAPKYTPGYHYQFDSDYNYSVLIDQGINSTSRDFMLEFPDARFIKVCYTDSSWPVVAKTMIDKAMKSSLEIEVAVDPDLWTSTNPWTQREKYFLFLRDHALRTAWRPEVGVDCVVVDSLLDYSKFKHTIECTGIELSEFKSVWNNWYTHNERYFVPIIVAEQILDKIKHREAFDLNHITDVWTQAVIYYYLWTEFGKEVPHNDFENFFSNVDQITQWLDR